MTFGNLLIVKIKITRAVLIAARVATDMIRIFNFESVLKHYLFLIKKFLPPEAGIKNI